MRKRPGISGAFGFAYGIRGGRILRRASLAQDDRGIGKAGSSVCHSERSIGRCGVEESVFLVLRMEFGNPSVTPDGVTAPFTQGSLGRMEFERGNDTG